MKKNSVINLETGEINSLDVSPDAIPGVAIVTDEFLGHFEVVNGRFVLDDRPVESGTGLRLPLSRAAEIQRYIQFALSERAVADGMESAEEADDFNIDEDVPLSPYELATLDGAIHDEMSKRGFIFKDGKFFPSAGDSPPGDSPAGETAEPAPAGVTTAKPASEAE